MDRKLFGIFSGTHVVIMFCAALAVPSALYGAVSYQAVAVVDATTGAKLMVDSSQRLHVYDGYAAYQNNPANFVTISGGATSDGIHHAFYTVPAGKALIIKSVNFTYYEGVSGDNYFYIYDQSSGKFITGFDDPNAAGAHNVNLGTGWYSHAGSVLSYGGSNGANAYLTVMFSIQGYLVPDNAVPAAGTLEAAEQSVQVNGGYRKR